MYMTANGMNTASVMTSWMILSWASDSTENPTLLAGTCSRYSKSAMPHETSAAIHQGLACRCLRCPYHANVMKRFEQTSRVAHASAGVGMAEAGGIIYEGSVVSRRRAPAQSRHYRRYGRLAPSGSR